MGITNDQTTILVIRNGTPKLAISIEDLAQAALDQHDRDEGVCV